MLYQKLFDIIDKSRIGSFVSKKQKVIEETIPDRVHVENVRSFFSTSTWAARQLCEMAVREGLFDPRIGLICPNSECERIINSYGLEDEIEDTIFCETCESRELDHVFETKDLKRIKFYRLKV